MCDISHAYIRVSWAADEQTSDAHFPGKASALLFLLVKLILSITPALSPFLGERRQRGS